MHDALIPIQTTKQELKVYVSNKLCYYQTMKQLLTIIVLALANACSNAAVVACNDAEQADTVAQAPAYWHSAYATVVCETGSYCVRE